MSTCCAHAHVRPVRVLGLCYSHDASACLLQDGVPVVAIQKERLTRRKHDGNVRDIDLVECIRYCLDAEGIGLEDIDLVVENSPTVLYCRERNAVLGLPRPRLLDGIPSNRVIQISHHLAHAYCAYGLSPFESAAVLVVDGQGNCLEDLTEELCDALVFPSNSQGSYTERESFYGFDSGAYTVLRKNFSPSHRSDASIGGIGHLYAQVSSYVFQSWFDAGKLMGLAPYGTEIDEDMLRLLPNGEMEYDMRWARYYNRPRPNAQDFAEHFKHYADLAASAQAAAEAAVSHVARWLHDTSALGSLCYAGGVALNCAANRRVLDESGFDQVFIAPPANDCGVSVGCAFYGYLNHLRLPKRSFDYRDFLGKNYSEDEIDSALSAASGIEFERMHDIVDTAARLMANGSVIGWFQGGSEFGPRALGNRSLLCDPRKASIVTQLNEFVKQRESFRPFAPVVLQERAHEFFDVVESPYMLVLATVCDAARHLIPAVTHVDNTARLQTVRRSHNARYYDLVWRFGELTGVPVLLNTSFNGRGEPIVESPTDAIGCLLTMPIDCVCLGDYVARRC